MPDATRDLFERAVDLPAGERDAFVASACGDDAALRRRLAALLRAHDTADGFLEHPTGLVEAAAVEIAADGDDLEPGQRIGAYTLVSRLGRGGFGTVWRARQSEPVQRDVALKLLRGGLDTGRVMQRFLAERQTLARMEHPSIARMFDAGATAAGQPWLAMELVDGLPITRYAEERSLGLRERLGVFAAVCQAVQHAHGKGVVHRDLKPSNVLVVHRDGAPHPVVIDFGVARVLDDDGPALTATGDGEAALGTPDYMSPEQAANDRDAIDTRTDVWSLGVLLYELVAGALPFERASGPLGAHELLRRIRDEDAPPPSRRTKGRRAPGRRLPREIDWIVARAMARDPAQRYQTAAALADDVRRLLDDEPVAAGPPGALYRLRTFVRRHAVAVAAAAAVALALGVGLVVAARGWIEAERESAKANRALDLVDEVWEAANPGRFGRGDYPVRELFADFARELPRHTAGAPEVELRVRTTMGRLQRILGMLPDAEQHTVRAVTLAREVGDDRALARALMEHARVLFDRNDVGEAERTAVEAADACAALRPHDDALLADALETSSSCRERSGDRAAALALAERALALRRGLANGTEDVVRSLLQVARIHGGTGDVARAAGSVQEALRLLEPFGRDHPDAPTALQHLAFLQQRQGDWQAAETSYRDSLQRRRALYGDEHPNVAWAEADLGWLLHERGRSAEAEPLLRHALDALRARLGEEHLYVSETMQRLGRVLTGSDPEAARALLVQSLERFRTLPDHPADGRVACLGGLAALQWQQGERTAARTTQAEALAIAREELPRDHFVVSIAMTNAAWFAAQLDDAEAAIELLREALALSSRAGRAGEARIQRQRLAELLDGQGRADEAAAVRDAK